MDLWKIIFIIFIFILFGLNLIFRVRLDLIDWHLYIYYWNFKNNKRMTIVI